MPEPKMTLYRTSDIYFAAFLCAIDIELLTSEPEKGNDGGRKLVFVFKVPDNEIRRLKASFFGGQATVKVRRYVDYLKNLKAMVYI